MFSSYKILGRKHFPRLKHPIQNKKKVENCVLAHKDILEDTLMNNY